MKANVMLFAVVMATCGLGAAELPFRVSLNRYDGRRRLGSETLAAPAAGVLDREGGRWDLKVRETAFEGGVEYAVECTLREGAAKGVSLGIDFGFDNWSTNNFVLVPAAVYKGNRFKIKQMKYSPNFTREECRVDMPMTVPMVPHLSDRGEDSLIELNTGSAATPLMAFYAPAKSEAWMVQTLQRNRFGNYGLFIAESPAKATAKFSITSPCVREFRATGDALVPSSDTAADLKAGDSVDFRFRTYRTKARGVNDLFAAVMKVRKDLNPVDGHHQVLPYSAAWGFLDRLFQNDRWDDSVDLFCLTKPGTSKRWCMIWQLGWCGGGQATLPMLLQGDDKAVERAIRNLDTIFKRTQTSSGFFYASGDGHVFKGTNRSDVLVRSEGDFLYMAQLQFEILRRKGRAVPDHWKEGIRKLADAFMTVYRQYGQLGQRVDVETGRIVIGGSVSGGIVPGGLALAYRTFGREEYLKAAEELAEKYHQAFSRDGYTNAGPGDILTAPDSESAFGLFESFITLYEVTGGRKWLDAAGDLLPLCASWVVSYDYVFPPDSPMGKIGARSNGSVWANVANKHSAPAICTWSGDSLLKYYRVTGDSRALSLLCDIAHGVTQYICIPGRQIGKMEPGGICERVNLSDWEGQENVGGFIFASCSWVETAALLTVSQLPGVYLQTDTGVLAVFDNVEAKVVKREADGVTLELRNPTAYDAEVKIYAETAESARTRAFRISDTDKVRTVVVKSNGTSVVKLP